MNWSWIWPVQKLIHLHLVWICWILVSRLLSSPVPGNSTKSGTNELIHLSRKQTCPNEHSNQYPSQLAEYSDVYFSPFLPACGRHWEHSAFCLMDSYPAPNMLLCFRQNHVWASCQPINAQWNLCWTTKWDFWTLSGNDFMKNLVQNFKTVWKKIFIARALRGSLYLNIKPHVFKYLAVTIILTGKKYLLYPFRTYVEFMKK